VVNELALFAGAGGGILGGALLGWRCICAVEINEYCRKILMQRQDDGILQPFPVWDDIRSFDGRPWRGVVDVVSGGFPCQDISTAGQTRRRDGIKGSRSGLWAEMARVIREVEPRFVFVENSPALLFRGLGDVLGDLADMGFDARWCVLGAGAVGAPHRRERIWILANVSYARGSDSLRYAAGRSSASWAPGALVANADVQRREKGGSEFGTVSEDVCKTGCRDRHVGGVAGYRSQSWPREPDVERVADGVAFGVDRLTAIGNGQVPRVVARAWRVLTELRAEVSE
jgi:DNA (cytosine-5)-methyltransferase 1